MTESHYHRYAVYYAPAMGSDAWQAGSQWLGRCAHDGSLRVQPVVNGMSPLALAELTAAPRRYGWHATLKAPFTLAASVNLQQLRERMAQLAGSLSTIPMPRLQVSHLDDFLALTPVGDTTALDYIAAACVRELHTLVAPLSEAELQRRRKAPLTAAEDAMLVAWGYPYVFEHFRFHMSLTGSLHGRVPQEVQALQAVAQRHFDGLTPDRMDSLTLFAEPQPGADFVVLDQFPLAP
jgi:putative phosphonate metabolism protein